MDAEGWLTSELATFDCAACGQPYGEAQVRLIAQREELFFVDLSCPHCGSQAIAIVTIQVEPDRAMTETGRVVNGEEAGEDGEPAAAPIDVDDVLDMHAFLARAGGDVEQLMAAFDGPSRES
jgi:hypothetical protein